MQQRRFLVAQPNGLGDVVHTLPLAGVIKNHFPRAEVFFAARCYAQAVVMACEHVDRFVDFERICHDPAELAALKCGVLLNPAINKPLAAAARSAGIPERIGNARRSSAWKDCNRFTFYGRSSSGCHEAQLNLMELRAIGVGSVPSREQMVPLYGLTRIQPLPQDWRRQLEDPRFHLILHPRSRGHGREWPPQHFHALARRLPADRFRIYLSGVATEGELLRRACPELFALPQVVDITGRMNLETFISFAAAADGLVASGTGPLHIAAALGTRTLGLFPPRKGIDIVRWGALGVRAESMSLPQRCKPGPGTCPKLSSDGGACVCMSAISPDQVAERVLGWEAQKRVASDAVAA
ncbi:MAG: glycosyltransferase family 9 protein [Stenotrophobium sp.]